MADNELDLMQWQIGTQSQLNTGVTTTAKLIGVTDGSIDPIVETSAVREHRATLTPAYQATVDRKGGEAGISGDANFQQLAYELDSLFGVATPGAGPGFTRQWAAPIAAKPTPRILTLMRGSTLDNRRLVGAIANEFTLTAESNQRVKRETKFLGHSVGSGSLASLTDLVVDYIHANQAAITLDTWAGTMGGTALTTTAYKAELGVNMNRMMQMGLGSAHPKDHKIRRGETGSNQLKLSLELDSVSAAYYTNILAATDGPLALQAQITFTKGTLVYIIQYAGYADGAPKYIEDTDGVASLELVLSPMYHPTFANWLKMSLTSAVETLP